MVAAAVVEHPHITIEGDEAYIEGTRIVAHRLYSWHRQGTTVETMLRRYPQIGPARILSALAFCYDNREFAERAILKERERAMEGRSRQ